MRRPLALLGPLLALALTARASPPGPQSGAMPAPFPGSVTGGVMGGVVQPGQAPARDRQPGEPREGAAVIRGYVVAADTGVPLRRAQVRAFAMGGEGLEAVADPSEMFLADRRPGIAGPATTRPSFPSH